MRVFVRRERPHPGAQLTLFEADDGWRYSLWVTNLPPQTGGWRGQNAYIDAAHRVHARVEDVILLQGSVGLLCDVAWTGPVMSSAAGLRGCGARGW
jgi:hypothetical protein